MRCAKGMCPRSAKFNDYCPDHASPTDFAGASDQVFRTRDGFHILVDGKVINSTWEKYKAAQSSLKSEQPRSRRREADRARREKAKNTA